MKTHVRIISLCSIIFILTGNLAAQETAGDEPLPKRSWFQGSVDYTSDNVYMGRKDSTSISYLTPAIGYYHKSGFFISTSMSYLAAAANSHLDLFSFEGGYSFSYHKVAGGISATKYFYNSQSTNVSSEIASGINAYTVLDLGFMKMSLDGSANSGSSTDYALSVGVERSFYFLDDDLDVTPSLSLNASSQNAYGSYYKNRRYSGKRKSKMEDGISYDISAAIANAPKFRVLDYELSIPVNYTMKNCTFYVTPTLAIPTNPSDVTVMIKPSSGSEYSETYKEKLDNAFYWMVGMSYKFF